VPYRSAFIFTHHLKGNCSISGLDWYDIIARPRKFMSQEVCDDEMKVIDVNVHVYIPENQELS
jgi:hypothetical protein